MSRKCPSCKKWLAAGQFTCKCGAGEQPVHSIPSADLLLSQALMDAFQGGLSSDFFGFRLVDKQKVLQMEELLKKPLIGPFLANKDGFFHSCVAADAPSCIALALPLITKPLHEISRVSDGLGVICYAISLGRASCLKELLNVDKSRFDGEFVDKKFGVTPFDLCSDYICVGYAKTDWSKIPFGSLRDPQTKEATSSGLGSAVEDFRSMSKMLVPFSKSGQGLSQVEQMGLRAQQAAVAQQLVAPPPFPRVIWVLVVDRCDVRTRCVNLPRTCMFFRNLLPLKTRAQVVMDHFNLNSKCKNPAFIDFVCRVTADASRRFFLLGNFDTMCTLDEPMLKRLLLQPMTIEKSKPDSAYLKQPKGKKKNICITKIEGEVSAGFQIKTIGEDKICFKLFFSSSLGHVLFKLVTFKDFKTFGTTDNGYEGVKKLESGMDAVRRFCGFSGGVKTPKAFNKLLSILFNFGQTNFEGHYMYFNVDEMFFERFLSGSAELAVQVVEGKSLTDLTVSVDLPITVSLIQVMKWDNTTLAEFFQIRLGNDLVAQHVKKDKSLSGKMFVQSDFGAFVPSNLGVKEAKVILEQLEELRKTAFD